MKIICDSCGAKYTVSDEKVQGKTVKVKCRKCSAVIVVSSTGEVSTTNGQQSVPPAASADALGSFTVAVADGDQRTMSLDEVVSAYNEGYVDADTFVWAEGMDDWLPLRDVDAIVDALHDAATDGEAGVSGAGADMDATVAMVDGVPPEVASVPPAAAGVGATESPFESAMAAAGSSGGGFASSASFPSSPPVDAGGGLNQIPQGAAGKAGFSSGPGEENSAIFSLNMLTAKVGDADAPAPANFSDEEDSGLIDLKALASGISSDSALATPLDVAGGGGVFPLGAPPPPTAPAPVTVDAGPTKGSNKLMLAGLASAVVLLGAVLVFILVKGDGPPPAASETAAPATVVVTVTKTVEAVTSAEPTATATASASATSKVATRTPRGTGRAPKSTGKSPGKAKPAAAKPARGKCGCDPNDLMCNMRCAQK